MTNNYDEEYEQIKNLFISGILSSEEANSALRKLRSKHFIALGENIEIKDNKASEDKTRVEVVQEIPAGWYPIKELPWYEGYWDGNKWVGVPRKIGQYNSQQKSNKKTNTAKIISIFGLVFVFIIAPIAVLLSHISLYKYKKQTNQDGKIIAKTGAILGWIFISLFILFISITLFANNQNEAIKTSIKSDVRNTVTNASAALASDPLLYMEMKL